MDWRILRPDITSSKHASESVLVVEDESEVRRVWRESLISLGYEVFEAEDAHQAVAMVKQQGPNVALCDVHLPGPSGLWVADQIRTISPTTAVILCTGDRRIPPAESLRLGILAYLVKPIRLNELRDAVEAGVRWSEQQRSAGADH